MSSVAPIDSVSARVRLEGQDGPRSSVAHQKREDSSRPAVEFGGALSHLNAGMKTKRVNPSSTTQRARGEERVDAKSEDDGRSTHARERSVSELANESERFEGPPAFVRIGTYFDVLV